MKRKIAILTTHRANNFGAVLQAYSLVMALREAGASAVVLDWRCRFFEWAYHSAWRMYRNPLPAIKHFIWYVTEERSIRHAFDKFRTRIPMSRPILTRRELLRVEEEYDTFVVGSDQVWNPINSAINPSNFDRANLLSFVSNKRKCAYAASIGVSEIKPDSLLPEFIAAWKTFDIITMREEEGSRYVGKHIGRNVDTVLDPVLLHKCDFWRREEAKISYDSGSFIFVYNVKNSEFLRSEAEKRAKRLGLKIVDIIIPSLVPNKRYCQVCAGPAEFLAYIDKAESVFTNSFHASAFATIFEKKLFLNKKLSGFNPNSRFETLQNLCGLQIVAEKFTATESFVEIDCRATDDILLNRAIGFSRNYLKEICS